jgi:hypothetical protein
MKGAGDTKRKSSHSKRRPGSRSKTSKKPNVLTQIKSTNKLPTFGGSNKMSSRDPAFNSNKVTLTPGLPPSGKGRLLISRIDDKSSQKNSYGTKQSISPMKVSPVKNIQLPDMSRHSILNSPNQHKNHKSTPQEAYNDLDQQKQFGGINNTFDNSKISSPNKVETLD